jgi:hypothetical protein
MTKTIELKRLSIDLNNDWKQVIGKYNWLEFNFLKLYVEKENIHGMAEVEIYVLGFGVRFYWTWNKEMLKKKAKEYNEMIEKDEWVILK